MRLGALVLAALVAAAACVPASPACAPLSGGDPGSTVQLRRIAFGNDQISFLFGLRAGSTYGVPPFSVERDGDALRVRLRGARLNNPDGTPSYHGERERSTPGGRIRDVAISGEGQDEVTVTLRVSGAGCARAAARRYILGTTHPAAMVSIALRDGPAVAFDPDGGAPGFGMQVVGLGFTPSVPVAFETEGRVVWTSHADKAGLLDTVFYVPQAAPGPHSVLIRNAGRAVTTWFRVE